MFDLFRRQELSAEDNLAGGEAGSEGFAHDGGGGLVAEDGVQDRGQGGAVLGVRAAALGVGSSLINQRLLDEGDFAALTNRARRFVQEVAAGREAT